MDGDGTPTLYKEKNCKILNFTYKSIFFGAEFPHFHTWRPRLPGGGSTRLARLAVFYPGCVIIAAVLPGTEVFDVFIVIMSFHIQD